MSMAFSLHANPYLDYIDGAIANFNQDFSNYNAMALDTTAALAAMTNIDFNPSHKGFSAGVGMATIHTGYGNGNAYSLGVQYGFDLGAFNFKGAYKERGEYIFGTGLVLEF